MGRHAAADGAGTDPIVAAALASQDGSATGTRHAPTADPGPTADPAPTADPGPSTGVATAGGGDEHVEGGLGWPGDTTTGGGLGWPGSADEAGTDEGQDGEFLRETTRMDAVPAVPDPREGPGDDDEAPARRGWRRIFGGTAA